MSKVFKWIGIIVVTGFVLIIGLVVIGISSIDSEDEDPKVVESSTEIESEVSEKEETKLFVVGESIEFNNRILTVNSVQKNYTGVSYTSPKQGKEFIKVQVTIQNASDSEISYNVFDFEVQDSNGLQVDADASTYSLSSSLESGDLAPGGRVQGEMIFETPINDQSLSLIYSTDFWSDKEIRVSL